MLTEEGHRAARTVGNTASKAPRKQPGIKKEDKLPIYENNVVKFGRNCRDISDKFMTDSVFNQIQVGAF